MTIRELMSHTAGLAYGIGGPGPIDSMYAARGVLSRDQTPRDMIDKLAAVPLRHQPGTQWYYSIAVDVQGYLVEVLSGHGRRRARLDDDGLRSPASSPTGR